MFQNKDTVCGERDIQKREKRNRERIEREKNREIERLWVNIL